MPLDTGLFPDVERAAAEPQARRSRVALAEGVPVGAALREVRESLGLTLDQISEITKVRARHLESIEAGQPDQLPSRPFTIGYVRALAKALGLDADAVASRYR